MGEILKARQRSNTLSRALECDDNAALYVVGGGAGMAVTIADGADVALGATTDAESAAGNGTVVAILKRLRTLLNGGLPAALGQGTMAQSLPVVVASDQSSLTVDQATHDLLNCNANIQVGDADVGVANPVPIEAAPITTPTHTAVNVTVASGAVLAANANRLYALLVNDSDTVIYIKLGAAAVVNQGIRINAAGGNYEISSAFGNLYTGAIYGIHGGAGNKALLMTEGV